MASASLCLGLDFGTSGARSAVIQGGNEVLWQGQAAYGEDGAMSWPDRWQAALYQLLEQIPVALRRQTGAIALDGTSATVLLCDAQGNPLTDPLLYNDDGGQSCLPQLAAIAPAQSPVLSATSSLVKLLWWHATLPSAVWQQARGMLHQADWLGFLLHGQFGISDYHNALKLG